MQNRLKKIILLAGDIGVLYLALYLTLLIRYWQLPSAQTWQNHFTPFTIIFIGWLIIFYISNLYNLHLAVNNAKFFQITARALIIAGFLATAFFYLNPQLPITPKRNLFIFVLIFAILFFLWRQFFNWSLKSYLPKNAIAVIGYNNLVKELIKELKQKPHLGYNVAFIINDKTPLDDSANIQIEQSILPFKNGAPQKSEAVPVIQGYADLTNLISRKKVTSIVLTSSPHQNAELRNSLFACLPLKINYINLPNFYETITGRVPIDEINQMWFLENLSEGNKGWFDILKRFCDTVLALLILIISLPLWPIVGLLIKLDSNGPVFFKQLRNGKNNKTFKVIKFRTMKQAGNDFSPTMENDSRITKFGSILRSSRIDELPQAINIIKGEMSFVGPRPERPELIEKLEKDIPFYRERMLVKPGATGWDQISGEYHSPSHEDTLKKLQYDLYYIKNRSIYLDLSIILRTISTVLGRGGR